MATVIQTTHAFDTICCEAFSRQREKSQQNAIYTYAHLLQLFRPFLVFGHFSSQSDASSSPIKPECNSALLLLVLDCCCFFIHFFFFIRWMNMQLAMRLTQFRGKQMEKHAHQIDLLTWRSCTTCTDEFFSLSDVVIDQWLPFLFAIFCSLLVLLCVQHVVVHLCSLYCASLRWINCNTKPTTIRNVFTTNEVNVIN